MTHSPTDRPTPPARPPGDAKLEQKAESLRSMGWSDLDQDGNWPENFIVRPDPPSAGPPVGIALPVLHLPADRSHEADEADVLAMTEPALGCEPIVPGARLRQTDVEDDDDSEFHADPDSAPQTIRQPRSTFANWSFVWLVLLLLLGLAAVAWFGLPSLRQGG